MTEQTYIDPEMDRTGWGAGPWDGEPDKVSWTDADTGLPCLAVRGDLTGSWCGYVAVPPGHPLHGKGYGDEALYHVEVHGGLTFAGPCQENAPIEASICHVPEPGTPGDVHWFGFDCAHWMDMSPAFLARFPDLKMDYHVPEALRPIYKTLGYVRGECASLARQLKAHD